MASRAGGLLEQRLRKESSAEVDFSAGARGLYATDASLYQLEPIGVVIPRELRDVETAVRIAAEERFPVLPRGGATSLSGQTIGEAVVLDFSKYLNRIGIVDRDRMSVWVEPGAVLDRLNAHLKPLGLMFGPDVSTGDRATIGGMIGNNSAGARSLRYGKTVDHVRALDVILSDGTAARFGPTSEAELATLCARDDRLGIIHRTVRSVVEKNREAIAAHFPHILRRVSGYNLDEFVPGLPVRPVGWQDEPWQFNLARLIVGSEGTLAVVSRAELKVVPLPPYQGLVVLSFATIDAALGRLGEILETGPVAVEMVDRMILDMAAENPEYARHLSFAAGRPEVVLAAQFHAQTGEELEECTQKLVRLFEGRPEVVGIRTSLTGAEKDDFWKIRKAGVSLLMGMVGDAKPVAFVEDTAVSPEKLPAFYDRFRAIMARHGTRGACYGHADVGCLHIRPLLNVKTREGQAALRAIAREVAELVLEFGGAMSGEHGDGLARSRWNEHLFGREVYEAFREIKRAFDPQNRMNPGKVVASPDPAAHLRIGPDTHVNEPHSTAFDFSAQGGFARAVEMCSGVGACRKPVGGTMCPSYMVTRDEKHSTRGRANLLRLVLTGALHAEGMANDALEEALDLCLQCKACKTECPSKVDMAKLKAEYLHQRYGSKPLPLGPFLMGNIHLLNRIGAATAGISNAALATPTMRWLLEQAAGIDRRRTLPKFASDHLRKWFRRHTPDSRAGARGSVVLLDDCFTTYNTPNVGRAAVRVLEAAGYHVELAGIPCCGRAAISKGMLDLGRKLAEESVAKLIGVVNAGKTIVGCEPSCLLTLVDEYRDFRLGPDADRVAAACELIDSFIADKERVPELHLRPRNGKALLHGHCHQKALVGTAGTLAMLSRVEELEVRELDSGCCGMAGSFGYELGHYDVSKALANRVLIPAAHAEPDATLLAPGFSCRSQLHDLTHLHAIHPIELIAEQAETVRVVKPPSSLARPTVKIPGVPKAH